MKLTVKMSTKVKSHKMLKVGDKIVVTVENAIQDCVIVSMVFQEKKFCGALMDTTKKYFLLIFFF